MDDVEGIATPEPEAFPTYAEMRAKRLAGIGDLPTTDISAWEPAVDVARFPRTSEGYHLLPRFVPGVDYCDSSLPWETRWVTYIGRDRRGRILAALRWNPERDASIVELLWVR